MNERPAAVDFTDPALEADIRAGLDRVEAMLRDSVKSDYPFVTETSQHLVAAGGKRFRPLVVLLASQFGDATAPGVVPAGPAAGLTPPPTLYHHHLMGEGRMRGGAGPGHHPPGETPP